MGDDFDDWLRKKLADISPGCDIDVFVAYLRGILETEPSQEEQLQSVCDTLEELGVAEKRKNGDEVLRKWHEFVALESNNQTQTTNAITDQLAVLIGQQLASKGESISQHVIQTKEEQQRKAAIIAQYGTIVDGEGSDNDSEQEDVTTSLESGDDLMQRNVNALMVTQRIREQREEAKQQHEQKKQKDKEEMQRQKQKVNERKDSEKKRTQKGEKRR